MVTAVLHCAKANTTSGAILFVFTDWRHLDGLLTAGRDVGLALVDLIVWAKDAAVSGGLYPCRHALVLAFQNGAVSHTADLKLGQPGRTNVWDYAGVPGFRTGAAEGPARPPTRTPAALVADAIRDVTRRGAIVLDPFAETGTTIIAAEQTRRHGRAIERDPLFCDVIVRRWQHYTGTAARLSGSDLSFAQVEAARLAAPSGRRPLVADRGASQARARRDQCQVGSVRKGQR